MTYLASFIRFVSRLLKAEVTISLPPTTARLTLVLEGKGYEDIDRLRIKLGLDSVGEMCDWAIPFLEWGFDRVTEGEIVGSYDKNGRFTGASMGIFNKIKPVIKQGVRNKPEIYLIYSRAEKPAEE